MFKQRCCSSRCWSMYQQPSLAWSRICITYGGAAEHTTFVDDAFKGLTGPSARCLQSAVCQHPICWLYWLHLFKVAFTFKNHPFSFNANTTGNCFKTQSLSQTKPIVSLSQVRFGEWGSSLDCYLISTTHKVSQRLTELCTSHKKT